MTNGFRDLLVGGGEPIYVKLKEVEKLAVRHFKNDEFLALSEGSNSFDANTQRNLTNICFYTIDIIKNQ